MVGVASIRGVRFVAGVIVVTKITVVFVVGICVDGLVIIIIAI